MTQRFRSGIDARFAAIGVTLPIVLTLVLGATALTPRGPPWWTLLPLIVAVLLFVWILAGTWYAFDGGSLVVQCGPFRWRIPVEQIYAVRDSSSLRSGPALSMQRLEIRFANERCMLISPRDRAAFLAELRRQAPRLAHQTSVTPPAT